MKDLLENDYVAHHNLGHSRPKPAADCVATDLEEFDVDDTVPPILSAGEGKLTLANRWFGALEIASYERFVDQCKKPTSFLQGRKKCDLFALHQSDDGYAVLVELTSALGTVRDLSKPIPRIGKPQYPGGKYEKAVVQLASSLADLLAVPEILRRVSAKRHKVCLMAYRLFPHTDPDYLMKHPMERYLKTEAVETADCGAVLSCPEVERYGFEYRRISHDYAFQLK